MKMVDIVNNDIEKFKTMLKSNIFNENDIEEFLKSNSEYLKMFSVKL